MEDDSIVVEFSPLTQFRLHQTLNLLSSTVQYGRRHGPFESRFFSCSSLYSPRKSMVLKASFIRNESMFTVESLENTILYIISSCHSEKYIFALKFQSLTSARTCEFNS